MGGLAQKLTVTKVYRFRASHSLEAPAHRRDEIGELCGVLHGHEYQVEVCFAHTTSDSNIPNVSARHWAQELESKLFSQLQNIHLNDHFKFTSGEYLCYDLYHRCLKILPKGCLVSLAIQETAKNRFEIKSNEI